MIREVGLCTAIAKGDRAGPMTAAMVGQDSNTTTQTMQDANNSRVGNCSCKNEMKELLQNPLLLTTYSQLSAIPTLPFNCLLSHAAGLYL